MRDSNQSASLNLGDGIGDVITADVSLPHLPPSHFQEPIFTAVVPSVLQLQKAYEPHGINATIAPSRRCEQFCRVRDPRPASQPGMISLPGVTKGFVAWVGF